jgi:hypothetical protein
MVHKLNWVTLRVQHSSGIHFLKSVKWDPRHVESGTLTVFTDVSPIVMAYFIPSLKLAFQCPIPPGAASENIFFFEALAVCSVFHFAEFSLPASPRRLVIYSDNTNSVNIFNSLCAIAPYNQLLISAMNIVLDHKIDYRVLHVRGLDNPIADTVSRLRNDLAVRLCSGLVIHPFEPPRDALGECPK